MIVSEKEVSASKNPFIASGERQEKDVAFFLKRAFKDDNEVFVFNDYKFSFNGENAQIDHLILYPYGFILVESKSIAGQVKVNSYGEWSRSYNNNWKGMPSPIEQVELQKQLLSQMLHTHKDELLPKYAVVLTQSFRGRCWDVLCAISSNAIIDREDIPKNINKSLVKSEFLVDKIREIMKLPKGFSPVKLLMDSRPRFSESEMQDIQKGLLSYQERLNPKTKPKTKDASSFNTPLPEPTVAPEKSDAIEICCKSCGNNSQLVPSWGKFGYYVTCGQCGKNTPIKAKCASCGSSKTKASKKGTEFNIVCNECSHRTLINGLNIVKH